MPRVKITGAGGADEMGGDYSIRPARASLGAGSRIAPCPVVLCGTPIERHRASRNLTSPIGFGGFDAIPRGSSSRPACRHHEAAVSRTRAAGQRCEQDLCRDGEAPFGIRWPFAHAGMGRLLFRMRARRNGMDASHPVSAEHELSTAPVTFGRERPVAPGAVDNSAVVE